MNKLITSENIRMMLKDNWPNLRFIWPTDPKYIIMDFEGLKDIVKSCSVKNFKSRGNLWDCDNYALQLHAKVQEYQYCLNEEPEIEMLNSWAFGECIGIPNKGTFCMANPPHAINIAITNKGIALIEPNNDEVWVAGKNEMSLFFVKF